MVRYFKSSFNVQGFNFSCFPSFIGSLSSKFTQKLNPPPPAKTGLRIINQSNKKEATQHYSIFKNDKVNIPEVAV